MSNLQKEKKRVLILTNDIECARNVQYCAKVEKYFSLNGWEINSEFYNVDKIIICACGFHYAQFNKVKKVLNKFKDMNYSEDNIIIMGCMPKTHEGEINNEFEGTLIPFSKEDLLDREINASIPFKSVSDNNLFKVLQEDPEVETNNGFFIKIVDGCLGNCTYCVIKRAKGDLVSTPIEKVIAQFKTAVSNGYKKIQFIGEDTFAYGIDIGTDIVQLVDKLLAIDSTVEIYFGSVDMKWLKKYSESIISLCKRGIIKKLNIGLQHINDNILKRMGRGSVAFEEVYNIIRIIKEECPHIYVSVDIIVGFPGETKDNFNELVNFLKEDKYFNSIRHSGYSDNKHAASYKYEDKIDSFEVIERFHILNDALRNKSMTSFSNSPDSESVTYKKTFEEDIFICKDSYINL